MAPSSHPHPAGALRPEPGAGPESTHPAGALRLEPGAAPESTLPAVPAGSDAPVGSTRAAAESAGPEPTRATVDHLLDRGLAFDATRMLGRRRVLSVLGGAGLGVALAACGGSSGSASSATSSGSSTTGAGSSTSVAGATDAAACAVIPQETAGPYPGDGSNGPDVLAESGVVRRDITSSFGDLSGTAEGVPLTIELSVVEVAAGCDPYPGATVYLWHCTADGAYSLYSEGVEDQNFLRGVQEADAEGRITFGSIFPGCYDGRWPHIHFEVFASLDDATGGGTPIATSQLAFPQAICETVYATDGYDASASNLTRTSLESDMVFSDGVGAQLATISGDVASGITASLTVPV